MNRSDSATNAGISPSVLPENSSRAWVWPAIIIGVLSVHAIACLIVVMIASNDPSQAIIPDYYEKAVAWDDHQKQLADNAALGWTCTIEPSVSADMLGQRSVRISVHDRQGQPVEGATVTLRAFHHARGNEVYEAMFRDAGLGEYTAMVPLRRDGLWTFEVDVVRGNDHFNQSIEQRVGASATAQRR